MFKLTETRRAWWPVTFAGVTEEGDVVSNQLKMLFEIHEVDELAKLFREEVAFDAEAAAREDLNLSERMGEFVARFVRDWKEIAKANGDPLEFSPENLRRLTNVPNAYNGIVAAYRDCIAGRADTRSGN